MPVEDWRGFNALPSCCEYPGCGTSWTAMTHNFDKIQNTHHKRYGSYWDYIYVCGYHMNKLTIRWLNRVDILTKDSMPFEVDEKIKQTSWENLLK
jgi:hypothetical protein